MFILFGWGEKTVKNHGDTVPMTCSNCNNKVYFKLIRVKKWFTFFFIPVIPYSTKKFLVCSVCNNGYELTTPQYNRAKILSQQTISFKNQLINKEQYERNMEEANIFGKV